MFCFFSGGFLFWGGGGVGGGVVGGGWGGGVWVFFCSFDGLLSCKVCVNVGQMLCCSSFSSFLRMAQWCHLCFDFEMFVFC